MPSLSEMLAEKEKQDAMAKASKAKVEQVIEPAAVRQKNRTVSRPKEQVAEGSKDITIDTLRGLDPLPSIHRCLDTAYLAIQ